MNIASLVPAQPHAESSLPSVTPDALKTAMRSLAGGVSVVTAGFGEKRSGATVTSATALSVEPPTMIVNINRSSSTWPVINRFGHFCINILADAQQPIADRFAGKGGLKGAQRYQGAEWTVLSSGAPVLVGALASIDCLVEEVIERYSHAIIIGKVVSLTAGAGASLVYGNGRYGRITD